MTKTRQIVGITPAVRLIGKNSGAALAWSRMRICAHAPDAPDCLEGEYGNEIGKEEVNTFPNISIHFFSMGTVKRTGADRLSAKTSRRGVQRRKTKRTARPPHRAGPSHAEETIVPIRNSR